MIRDTLLLLELGYQITRKSLKLNKVSHLILFFLSFVLALVAAAASAGVGFIVGMIVSRNTEFAPLVPGFILSGAVVLLLLIGFGNSLSGLFLSNDLETFMVAPVDRRAVFVYKMLNGMGSAYLLIFVLAFPALVTFGLVLKFSVIYFIIGFILLTGAPLFGAAIGSLMAMLLARFAPMNRVREIFGAFASLMGFVCWGLSQLPRLWANSTPGASRQSAAAFEGWLRSILDAPIPTFWAGKGLIAAGHNQIATSLVQVTIYLLLTFGTFVLVVALADQLYATGWLRMQSSGVAHRKVQRIRDVGMFGRYPAELALALKDWRLRLRDLRLLVQMLSGVIIVVMIYIGIFNVSASPNRTPTSNRIRSRTAQVEAALQNAGESVQSVMLCAAIVSAGVLMLSNIAVTSFSMEGQSLWILKVAPVSAWQVLIGKLTAVGIPFIVITTILFAIAAMARHLHPLWSLYGWFGIELLGLSALSFKVAMSLPWANLNWQDPGKMGAGLGGCLAELGTYLYGIISGLILCLPLLIERVSPAQLPSFVVLSVILVVLLTVLLVGSSMNFAASRWSRLGETS